MAKKHMKRWSTSLIEKYKSKLQWGITSYQLEWPSSKKNLQTGTSPVVQWLRLCASTAGGKGSIPGQGTKIPHAVLCSQKKRKKKRKKWKKKKLPYDPAIPLLGIYLEKTIIWKDTCTPMFIAALFTIARTWKQPKCPLTDKWIKMWYIYTMEY